MRVTPLRLGFFLLVAIAGLLPLRQTQGQQSNPTRSPLRIGMIGLDTSHAPEFTKLINLQENKDYPAKVTVAFPGGSSDLPTSRDRVQGYTEQLEKMGVKIVDSIERLVEECDAVLLESVDGRKHLEQVEKVFQAKLPVFIDKPLAENLTNAIAIHRLAEKHHGRWFSSSSLRFSPSILRYRTDPKYVGKVVGALAWSPCSLEKTHSDLFWYGIHGVETLYTIMGSGCEVVACAHTDGTDVVTGTWKDGRIGIFRGIRQGKASYGAVVFGEDSIELDAKYDGYGDLVREILQFFHGGDAPVGPIETIEMMAFMQAAQASREAGGAPIRLETLWKP